MALVTNNISGSSSDSSKIGITGSVIISNSGDAQFPSIGSDAVLFVSGSETAKSVFGGAAKISGSLSTDGNVTLGNSSDDTLTVTGTSTFAKAATFSAGLSGSLTKLADGTSYLIAGTNVTITSASNGAVTISSAASGSNGVSTDTGWSLVGGTSTQTFSYVSGTVQSFTVPTGVTSISAYVWAAGGGTGGYSAFRGGAGGFASGSITVTPGDTLYVVVGGGGSDAASTAGDGGLGGWPNAGFGTRGDASGGGGGGYSGIFSGSSNPQQVNALLIAGGGGGGTGYKAGGGGGGTTGNVGGSGGNPGQGGTQSAGGTAGNGDTSPPRAGSALTGGNAGGTGQDDNTTTGVNDGGGGGSGYYGGGGGASDGSGGGGGSGYYHPSKVTGGSLQAGADGQNGALTSPAATDSPYYSAGIGVGSAYTSGGGNGYVVLTYSTGELITYTTASVIIGGSDLPSETNFYVSGTIGSSGADANKAIFGGDVVASGSLLAMQGLSGSLTKLTDGTSYLIAGTNVTITSASNGAVTINSTAGGGSGAPTGAQYVTLATNASLTDERVLTAGSGISITDGGAGSTVTISATGTSDPSAQYLVLASTASLSNERTFTPGTGLTGTDGGANSNYVLAINDSVVATVSGTSFTGPISSTGFTSTDRVLITSGSSRTISQAGALIYDSTNQYLGIGTTPSRNVHVANGFRLGSAGSYVEWVGVNSTITRITVGGTQTTLEMNQDTLFPPNKTIGFQSALASAKDSGFSRAAAGIINVSGSAPGALFRFNASSTPLSAGDLGMNTTTGRPNALIGGVARELAHVAEIAPSTASYVVIGLDSSLPNDRVLTAGSGISITDGGAGSTITISATGGGSGGADAAASYVVLSATSSLSNERVLAAGSGISITDGGPGGSVTIAATGGGGGGGDTYFSSTTAGSIFTSGSAAFKGNEFVDSPADKGTDVFFYVSGSTTQKALFGGDVRISGSLTVGTGSVTLTSNNIQFGSSTNRLELSGSKLKLFDGANTSGITLGSDLILVESKYITGDTQTITFSNLDGDRDRAYYLIMNRAQGGSTTSFEIRPNGTTSNLLGYYHFVSSAGSTHSVGSYGSSISFGGSIPSGSFGTLEVVFSATRFSRSRVFNLRHNYVNPGVPSYNQNSIIGVWSDTSTLLTSLDIYGSTSSAFLSGTHVHLYKLRNA